MVEQSEGVIMGGVVGGISVPLGDVAGVAGISLGNSSSGGLAGFGGGGAMTISKVISLESRQES